MNQTWGPLTGMPNATARQAKTSDAASGQAYNIKYGSDWPTGWTTADDAYNYLTTPTASNGANWNIT